MTYKKSHKVPCCCGRLKRGRERKRERERFGVETLKEEEPLGCYLWGITLSRRRYKHGRR